jgi:hypothetical protein
MKPYRIKKDSENFACSAPVPDYLYAKPPSMFESRRNKTNCNIRNCKENTFYDDMDTNGK